MRLNMTVGIVTIILMYLNTTRILTYTFPTYGAIGIMPNISKAQLKYDSVEMH